MNWHQVLAAVGSRALEHARRINYIAASAFTVVAVGLRPGTWRPTVRDELVRQVLDSGVKATPFTSRVAFLIGISVVVQAQIWLRRVGQSNLLGPILVAVVIREVGPLLANIIVIG